jgi:two-component system sensor histidine kinase GlrK
MTLKLTIFKRLVIGYLLIIILVSALGIYILFRLNHLDRTIQSMNTVDVAAIRLVKEIIQGFYSQISYEKKYTISRDSDFLKQFDEISDYLADRIAQLERIADAPEVKSLTLSLKHNQDRYLALFERIKTNTAEGRDLVKRDNVIASMEFAAHSIVELSDKSRDLKLQASGVISSQIIKAITITGIALIASMVLVSLILTRSINTPIKLLQEKTKVIAEGEFGRPLEIASPPEIKELAESFNVMCSRLQELDQVKIDYISHLSHELRTPLTAIKEALSMLMEGVYAADPEKQQDLFDIVKNECDRLIGSVNRILDLSRMEAGMAQFQFGFFDLPLLVRHIGAKLDPIAERKNIRFSLDIPENIPNVKMDEDKIGQVIENVLGNALKFTDVGGHISITLSENNINGTLEVTISDTGCGIPEENLQEIFDKFKRVDDRKKAVRGTGLGLAIARHIINAHGGSIGAESEPGNGSTFIFSLPLLSVVS